MPMHLPVNNGKYWLIETAIELISDHLCNILLHGSEDLSLEENKKSLTMS